MGPTVPPRLQASVTAVLADPRFDAAMLDYARGITDFYRSTPDGVAVIGDIGRFGIVAALIVAGEPISLRRSVTLLAGAQVASAARVANHVRFLAQRGLVGAVRLPGQRGGGRRWAVTERAHAMMHGWLRAVAGTALRWHPLPHPDLASPAVLRAYLAQVLAAGRRGQSVFTGLPRVERLMQLSAGHALLLSLLLGSAEAAGRPFAFSRAAFAAANGVSRSHVIDLIEERSRAGDLHLGEDRRLALSAAFDAELRQWTARLFVAAVATLTGDLEACLPGR